MAIEAVGLKSNGNKSRSKVSGQSVFWSISGLLLASLVGRHVVLGWFQLSSPEEAISPSQNLKASLLNDGVKGLTLVGKEREAGPFNALYVENRSWFDKPAKLIARTEQGRLFTVEWAEPNFVAVIGQNLEKSLLRGHYEFDRAGQKVTVRFLDAPAILRRTSRVGISR